MERRDYNNFGTDVLWKAAKSAPMLSAEAEPRLARAAQQGSKQAFEELLNAHLRLVLTIAHDFSAYGLALDDLVSEGLLGLVEAARRFDPDRGVRLAAYAAWWIRAYMRRYTIMNRRIVRAPSSRHGRKLLANLRRTQRELAQQTGSQPDAQAVATALGVGVRDVEEMEAALSGRDVPCGADNDGKSIDLAADDPTPEAIVAEQEERVSSSRAIDQALALLSDRERQIFEQRYFTDKMSSLASIGREMGLSRERVRQLEHQARARIRHAVLPSVA
jgi:RNA polymerase sigma-32 factor